MTAYFLKGRTIAAVITAWLAEGNGAAVKDLPDNGGYFANTVILLVVADVKDLVVHGLAGRLQSEDDRLADVLDVDQRSPRRSIARHPDLFRGPGELGEVIEDNVEPHARAAAKYRGVAQEYGEKLVSASAPTSRSTSTLHLA